MTKYKFRDPEELASIANDNSRIAHADEKPLYARSDDMADSDAMAQTTDGDSLALERLDGHKLTYNPQNGRTFAVVTSEYEIINPPEFVGPLASELKERDLSVSGHVTQFDGSARGYAEVLLHDREIWPQDRDGQTEPVRTGLTFRWSHDGGISVRASGFAQDGRCSNTMRQVSDSVYVKHAGDVDERVDFEAEWSAVLDQLGAFSDALETVITDAWDYTLFDLADHSFEDDWLAVTESLEKLDNETPPVFLSERERDALAGFFDLLGFPQYLNYASCVRLMTRLQEKAEVENIGGAPTDVTAWDAYSAATYALTHAARFDNGSPSDDRYHRAASDLLQNPELALREAEQEVRRRTRPDADQETLGVDTDEGDAMRRFKANERELQNALQSSD